MAFLDDYKVTIEISFQIDNELYQKGCYCFRKLIYVSSAQSSTNDFLTLPKYHKFLMKVHQPYRCADHLRDQ